MKFIAILLVSFFLSCITTSKLASDRYKKTYYAGTVVSKELIKNWLFHQTIIKARIEFEGKFFDEAIHIEEYAKDIKIGDSCYFISKNGGREIYLVTDKSFTEYKVLN